MNDELQIAVVGSGYVGLVAAVCFAEMGHKVICVDNDEHKVAALQGGDTLIHEDHLPELLNRYRNSRVRFMTDLAEATRECQAIFIAVGTPQSENGDADLSYVEAVACEIARSITSYKVIVEKSTVPVYTNEWIRRTMERNGVARELFDVVSNPEFLREGTAVCDFLPTDPLQANDGRVISNLMFQALRGQPLTIYGDGSQTRSFCFVSDLIEGILRLSRSAEHTPVNIGNPIEWTILECAREVKAVTGAKVDILFSPLPQDDPLRRRPDITRARQLLDWEPVIPLREGLQLSLDYFRACVEAKATISA
jgi:nucleoside-diphosphate-sugar epimerase